MQMLVDRTLLIAGRGLVAVGKASHQPSLGLVTVESPGQDAFVVECIGVEWMSQRTHYGVILKGLKEGDVQAGDTLTFIA